MLLLVSFTAACENDDDDLFKLQALAETDMPVGLARDVQPIFTQSCALSGCHAGAFPAANMSLEEGRLFDPQQGIVDVPSVERLGLVRVLSGDADSSYLVNKIEGTQAAVGGAGDRMPPGAAPLPDFAIDIIRRWIDEGALDN